MDDPNNVIMTPYAQSYESPKDKSRWLVPGAIVLVLMIIIIVISSIVVFSSKSKEDTEADEFVQHVYDETAEEEVLNDEYAKVAARNNHADYVTAKDSTRYTKYLPMEVCKAMALDCPSDLQYPDERMQIGAINSKAMDYYLDNGKILILMAKYESNATPVPTVIYARNQNLYMAFNPQKMDNLVYVTRWQLLDPVVGVPVFYALE